jgi:hypothetical protein
MLSVSPSRTVPLVSDSEMWREAAAVQDTVPPFAVIETEQNPGGPAVQPATDTVVGSGEGGLVVGWRVGGRVDGGRVVRVGVRVVGGADVGVSVGEGVSLTLVSSLGDTLADEESSVPTIAPWAGEPSGLSDDRGR